jgi:hypothetical protein
MILPTTVGPKTSVRSQPVLDADTHVCVCPIEPYTGTVIISG